MVTFTPNVNGTGTVDLLEAVEGDVASATATRANCGNAPGRGCLTNNWGNILAAPNVGNARRLYLFKPPKSVSTTAKVGSSTVSTGSAFSVCYSPGGRAYVNTTGTCVSTLPLTSSTLAVMVVAPPNAETEAGFAFTRTAPTAAVPTESLRGFDPVVAPPDVAVIVAVPLAPPG